MPVFNGERSIDRLLKSLLRQTFSNIKIIVSDNASSDSTWQIIQKYKKIDDRIKCERNPFNIGASQNFNMLVGKANTEFFMWAAADDYYHPDFIAECVEALQRNKDAIAAMPIVEHIMEETGKLLALSKVCNFKDETAAWKRMGRVRRELPATFLYSVFRTENLKKTGLIEILPGGDYPLFIELVSMGSIQPVERVLMTRYERSRWNSSDEDWKVFMGVGSKKPPRMIPISLTLISRIWSRLARRNSFLKTLALYFYLFIDFLFMIVSKTIYAFLFGVINKEPSRNKIERAYKRIYGSTGVTPIDQDLYFQRIIKTRLFPK